MERVLERRGEEKEEEEEEEEEEDGEERPREGEGDEEKERNTATARSACERASNSDSIRLSLSQKKARLCDRRVSIWNSLCIFESGRDVRRASDVRRLDRRTRVP